MGEKEVAPPGKSCNIFFDEAADGARVRRTLGTLLKWEGLGGRP